MAFHNCFVVFFLSLNPLNVDGTNGRVNRFGLEHDGRRRRAQWPYRIFVSRTCEFERRKRGRPALVRTRHTTAQGVEGLPSVHRLRAERAETMCICVVSVVERHSNAGRVRVKDVSHSERLLMDIKRASGRCAFARPPPPKPFGYGVLGNGAGEKLPVPAGSERRRWNNNKVAAEFARRDYLYRSSGQPNDYRVRILPEVLETSLKIPVPLITRIVKTFSRESLKTYIVRYAEFDTFSVIRAYVFRPPFANNSRPNVDWITELLSVRWILAYCFLIATVIICFRWITLAPPQPGFGLRKIHLFVEMKTSPVFWLHSTRMTRKTRHRARIQN